MSEYNLDKRANELVNYFKSMSNHYQGKNLMHTFGDDFNYANARMWFKNLDKLFDYINKRPELGVKFVYSTPSTYVKAIHEEGLSFPTKTDDFFPYADGGESYWTGYFTSRVSVKGFVRDFGRWLQAARKHIAEAKIRGNSQTIRTKGQEVEQKIWGLEMAMGILQHHDAVSGT